MLYLVGGVARAGKSQVATTMNNKYQIPWLSLDTLRWGLGKGAPSLEIDSNNDDQEDAARIWPIVEAMSDNILFDGRSYLIEGVCLSPHNVAALIARNPGCVRSCFLGYPEIDISEKVEATMRYDGPNDWLRRLGADRVKRFLKGAKKRSRAQRSECEACGLPFVDTGDKFLESIEIAVSALIQESKI